MEPTQDSNDVLDRVLNPADPTTTEPTAPEVPAEAPVAPEVPLDPRIDPNAVAPEAPVNEDPTAAPAANPDVPTCPAGHGELTDEFICPECGYDRKLEVQY
jgi:hypothetical protein